MAYTTINKSTDYFNTLLWTGNSGNQSITGNDFTADFTWSKARSHAESHILMDTVRDAGTTLNQALVSNSTNAEGTLNNSSTLTVNSTGFDLAGTSGGTLNYNGYTYASWLWKAGGHTGTSNSDGTISSTVSVNTTAGFSIVQYTGTGSNATVGHGLGVAPKMIILKSSSHGERWVVGHDGMDTSSPWNYFMHLEGTDARAANTNRWQNTAPTNSVFSLGTEDQVNGAKTYIAYCFAEKVGYSRFGAYTGNGSADGTFIYTGFKPAFVLSKNTSTTQGWFLVDNKRANPYNPVDGSLHPNANAAEDTASDFFVDFTSNGFKVRDTDAQLNASGNIYIYMAFAEAPLVGTNNIPCVAR